MREQLLELLTRKDGKLDGRKTNEEYFIRNNKLNLLDYFYNETKNLEMYSFRDRIVLLKHNILVPPSCIVCGNNVNIHQWTIHKHCSKKCTSISTVSHNKRKNTIITKYGVDHPMKSVSVKNKLKNTVLTKYGVEYTLQIPEIRERIVKTNIEKYGAANPSSNVLIKARSTESYIKNNITNEVKREELRERRYKTCLKKYNRKSNFQLKLSDDTLSKLENKNWLINEYSVLNKSSVQIAEEINCNYLTVINYLRKYGFEDIRIKNKSRFENYIRDFLLQNNITNIEFNNRKILEGKEIDIFLPDYNLGIEIDGVYYHGRHDKNYHQQKTLNAIKKEVDLIHITDFDITNRFDKIKNLLLNKLNKLQRIYARNTTLKEINSADASLFLENNHLQGTSKAKIRFGLYHDNILVQVATFGPSRFNKSAAWELIRSATLSGYSIVGGFSKLIKHFKKTYDGILISYVDLQYFSGKGYEKTGWKKEYVTSPGYYWIRKNEIISRYKAQKSKLNKLLSNYDSTKTEVENMENNGFIRYWNCGNAVYTL